MFRNSDNRVNLASRLPPDRLTAVLLRKPFFERREVVANRGRVHFALAGKLEKRVLPGLAGAHFEHRIQFFPRVLVAVNRTAIQRTGAAGGVRKSSVKLELQNIGEKVPGVRHIRSDVVLCARIEIRFERETGGVTP